MIIYPYKPASESAKALAEALGCKRIAHKGSKFKPAANKTIINWGASKMPEELLVCKVLNHPDAVALASDKLKFFAKMSPKDNGVAIIKHKRNGQLEHRIQWNHGYVEGLNVGDDCHVDPDYVVTYMSVPQELPRVPTWTSDRATAERYLQKGETIVCRTVLNGNSGEGIVIAKGVEDLVAAPLYVVYVPKKQEYRIHVLNGEVVDVQRKARRKDIPDDQVNWLVRNHDNGFIFARGEELGEIPDDVLKQAVVAVKACGLDFGAVDVIYNNKQERAYVLEVNTAPGLTGQTLEGYAARLKNILE